MKWLPFFILFAIASCKSPVQEKKENIVALEKETETYSIEMPFDTERDSGYFKGYPYEHLDETEKNDTTMLSSVLSNLISKKDIILLDSQTLSHSVFINRKTQIRFDTLRNDNTLITSEYGFSEKPYQVIKLNNKVIKTNIWKETTASQDLNEDILDLDGSTFRHFQFKGQEFYYIGASIMDGYSGSLHTVYYHLIYSVKGKEPDIFMTCRFYKMLFGDADNDNYLDYLDFDNGDFCAGVPFSDNVIIKLYSFNKSGRFVPRMDKNNRLYFIQGRTGNEFKQDSLIIEKHYWPRSIYGFSK